MKVDVTKYSNIIHTIYAVIFFLVNSFNFQYYSGYLFGLASTATCLIVAIVPSSFLIYSRRGLKTEVWVYKIYKTGIP